MCVMQQKASELSCSNNHLMLICSDFCLKAIVFMTCLHILKCMNNTFYRDNNSQFLKAYVWYVSWSDKCYVSYKLSIIKNASNLYWWAAQLDYYWTWLLVSAWKKIINTFREPDDKGAPTYLCGEKWKNTLYCIFTYTKCCSCVQQRTVDQSVIHSYLKMHPMV